MKLKSLKDIITDSSDARSCRDKGAPNWMYWEFEDGLTNAIAGATESALGTLQAEEMALIVFGREDIRVNA
jgi:hypothetical protein